MLIGKSPVDEGNAIVDGNHRALNHVVVFLKDEGTGATLNLFSELLNVVLLRAR